MCVVRTAHAHTSYITHIDLTYSISFEFMFYFLSFFLHLLQFLSECVFIPSLSFNCFDFNFARKSLCCTLCRDMNKYRECLMCGSLIFAQCVCAKHIILTKLICVREWVSMLVCVCVCTISQFRLLVRDIFIGAEGAERSRAEHMILFIIGHSQKPTPYEWLLLL